MEEIKILEYKKMDLSDSMILVAFPTVGMISSIAGNYIIDSLNLKEIGSITSRFFSPTAIIHKSQASPPVRVYAGSKSCGPDGSCGQLVVIISEFMPPWEIIQPLSEKILEWANKKNVKIITALEGTHALGEAKREEFKVHGIASTPKMKKFLDKYDVDQTKEGMITGVTGVLLYKGVLEKRDVICLLSEAHEAYPDSRSAANLVKKLDIILPGIKIDAEPLYKEAEKIESNIKRFLEQSKPTAPALPKTPMSMYG
jgi:uncharacterized protein